MMAHPEELVKPDLYIALKRNLFDLKHVNSINLAYRYIDNILSKKQPRIRKLSGPDVSC